MIASRRVSGGLCVLCCVIWLVCMAWGLFASSLMPGPDAYTGDGSPVEAVTAICFPSGEGLVNVNSDDVAQLMKLSGIGEGKAQAILQERLARGDYRYPQELAAVNGIGLKTVEKLRNQICFE